MSGISESFRADRLVRAATSPAIIDENLRPLRASLDDGIDGKERVIEKPTFPSILLQSCWTLSLGTYIWHFLFLVLARITGGHDVFLLEVETAEDLLGGLSILAAR